MDISATEFYQEVSDFFTDKLTAEFGSPLRQGQLDMALAVAHSLIEGHYLAVEAGTGVGKSLAYSVPLALWRLHGSKIVPVITTKTLNLQDQLFRKDLPLLQKMFKELYKRDLQIVLARGKSNYLCLKRFHQLWHQRQDVAPEARQQMEVAAKIINADEDRFGLFADESEVDSQFTGARSDFKDTDKIWPQVCCDTWLCNNRRCSYFSSCYLYRERRQLNDADIVVANHSLVMSDAALRRNGYDGILPSVDCLIFDEAHNLESAATEHLSYTFSQSECNRLLRHLAQGDEGHAENEGLLMRLRALVNMLNDSEEQMRWNSALDRWDYDCLEHLYGQIYAFFERVRQCVGAGQSDDNIEKRLPIDDNFLEFTGDEDYTLLEEVGLLQKRFNECSALLGEIENLARNNEETFADVLDSITTAREEVRSQGDCIAYCLNAADENWIHWVSVYNSNVELKAAPLHIGSHLNEALFKDVRIAVMTSATLSVAGDMNFFLNRLGLNLADSKGKRLGPEVRVLLCPSPFDYGRQALLEVCVDVPLENFSFIVPHLTQLIVALGGRTLILATSWASVKALKERLVRSLKHSGIKVLAQDPANADKRSQLVEQLRRKKSCVLIGTDSFWEGVDVPGDALQCVVILKVPFSVPTDPLHKARCDDVKRRGGRPFLDYTVPLAVTKMRQGVGRLIRSIDDRGIILLLDSRIYEHASTYGKTIVHSLPCCGRICASLPDAVERGIKWLNIAKEDFN